jgi:hypothetical protein
MPIPCRLSHGRMETGDLMTRACRASLSMQLVSCGTERSVSGGGTGVEGGRHLRCVPAPEGCATSRGRGQQENTRTLADPRLSLL